MTGSSPRQFVALVNPVSGNQRAIQRWDEVAFELTEYGHHVSTVITESEQHAIDAATQAGATGALVISVGGDGLVRDVAAGVVPVGATMGIVPSGRGNDLAGLLGIPTDPRALAKMLTTGTTRLIDVLDVNGHVVPGNVYVGIDSLAGRYVNTHRRVPALALYRGAALAAAARWKPTEFTLTYVPASPSSTPGSTHCRGPQNDHADADTRGHDDGTAAATVTTTVKAHDIVVANSGRYGNGLQIVPTASLDDGVIDVLIVYHGSPFRVVSMLVAAQKGTHLGRDDVDVIRATSIRIESDRDVPFGADGDEVTNLPAEVSIRPKALSVIIPSA